MKYLGLRYMHTSSCIPDTSEILMNVQISYKHSWLYLAVITTSACN